MQDDIISFQNFFYNLDDETLLQVWLMNPQAVYNMCMMLSLDIQLEKEQILLFN